MKFAAIIINTIAVILVIAAFSPLVIPSNQIYPKLMGWPYTMWAGTVVCILLVILTYLASLDDPDPGENGN